MNKKLFFFVFVLVCGYANSQQGDSLAVISLHKEQLLSKAKTQKTVGWIMVGTGAPVALGSLIAIVALSSRDFDQGTGLAILAGSTAYTFVGYSLIKSGIKNKREGLSINLVRHQLPPMFARTKFLFQPGFSIQLRF